MVAKYVIIKSFEINLNITFIFNLTNLNLHINHLVFLQKFLFKIHYLLQIYNLINVL